MANDLRATFLIGTLKPDSDVSHTEALARLLGQKLELHKVTCEYIRLAERTIPVGNKSEMGADDQWPGILEKLHDSDIIIFGTPIWFGSYSSLIQKVIERMDGARGPEFTKNGKSPFSNKVGGIVVTGGQDGAEYIIGHLAMFLSWVGLALPPACSLTVLGGINFEEKSMDELIEGFKKGNDAIAGVAAANLAALAGVLKEHQPYPVGT